MSRISLSIVKKKNLQSVISATIAGVLLLGISWYPVQLRPELMNFRWGLNAPDPDRLDSGDYIHNGGFETGGWDIKENVNGKDVVTGKVANDWFIEPSPPPHAVQFTLDNSAPHSDKTAQLIAISDTPKDNIKLAQMRILPRGYFTGSVWLKASPNNVRVTIQVEQDRSKKIFTAKTFTVDDTWRRYSINGYNPTQCAVFFKINPLSKGSLRIDDTSLKKTIDPIYVVVIVLGVLIPLWIIFMVVKKIRNKNHETINQDIDYRPVVAILSVYVVIALAGDIIGYMQYATVKKTIAQTPLSRDQIALEKTYVHYSLQLLTPGLPAKAVSYHGGGMNSAGLIVGTVDSTPICWKNGIKSSLSMPVGVTSCTINGMNEHGDTVGISGENSIVWRNDIPQILSGYKDYPCADALSVNNNGVVAGRIYKPVKAEFWAVPARACLWDINNKPQELPLPSQYKQSRIYAINDHNQAVGWALTQNNKTHAALWDNGKFSDLGLLPGGDISGATGINNDGTILGNATDAKGGRHIVIWNKGKIEDLGSPPECPWFQAVRINARGTILIDIVHNSNPWVATWNREFGYRIIALPSDCEYVLQRSAALNDNDEILGCGVSGAKDEIFDHLYFLLKPIK